MATKTVTLKDSNGDTLYPVTDSNVVNINQQKTLAQALDGVVYAEDPTQSATPTAWITPSDIDWSAMTSTYAHASTNTRVQYPASFGNFLTVTAPQTGIYRIESMAHASTSELQQAWYAQTRITVNGSVPATFDQFAESLIAGNVDFYACATISNNGVLSLTQGDVVALQLHASKNNSKCQLAYADLFIQRIS